MTGEDALVMIRAALTKVSPGAGDVITFETDLVEDGFLDSLDLMKFVFQVEQKRGTRIDAIDETFDDFRVARLVAILSD